MKEIKTYDSTPVSMLDNMHTMTGVEFECKDGIVTEIDGSRDKDPNRRQERDLVGSVTQRSVLSAT